MTDSKKIVKGIGKLNNNKTITKEVNIVQWDDNNLYIDIRKWSDGVSKKGISLNLYEAKKLKDLLNVAISSLENMLKNDIEDSDYNKAGYDDLDDLDIL